MNELEKILNSQFQSQEQPNFPSNNFKIKHIEPIEEEKKEFQKEEVEDVDTDDDDDDEFELDSADSYGACHAKIKKKFTIKQKACKTGGVTERVAFCKTKNCEAKAKLIQYGKNEDSKTKLLYNKKPHLPLCKEENNVFDSSKLREFLELGYKPKKAINKFNKLGGEKITNNEENRRKLTQIKYIINKKKREDAPVITNSRDLQLWIDTFYFQSDSETFKNLSWDAPFVSNYEIDNECFLVMITTKNSLLNFLKQANTSLPLIALDATYNLNVPGYPTIVVGTIDLHRKFHLGIIFFFI